jgi:hypothetical protein
MKIHHSSVDVHIAIFLWPIVNSIHNYVKIHLQRRRKILRAKGSRSKRVAFKHASLAFIAYTLHSTKKLYIPYQDQYTFSRLN